MSGRKPYTPVLPLGWWLEKPFYIRYMLRELSSFFVGTYAALLVVALWRVSLGPEAWESFRALMASPWMLLYHGPAFVFTTYHSVTWFALFPRTAPMMMGEDFVPPAPLIAGQYAAFFGAAAVVLTAAFWF